MSPVKTQQKLTFAQGLQLYFIQRIFDEYIMSTFFGDDNTNKFLIQWSEIVRNGIKEDPNFPFRIKVPEGFGEGLKVEVESEAFREGDGKRIPLHIEKGRRIADISFIPEKYREAYRPLLENSTFSGLFHLLCDEDLGRLMQIECSAELAELAKITAPAPKSESKDADIIREAAARSLDKKPEELTKEEIEKITNLDLSGRVIEEIDSVSDFKNLQTLDLSGNQLTSVPESLGQLQSLQILYLRDNNLTNKERDRIKSSLPENCSVSFQ